MRTHFAIAFCLIAPALLAQQPQRGDRGGRRSSEPVALENFTHAEGSFRSEAVGKDVSYGIYLPKGYEAEENAKREYPLVVWLHGMWEDHQRFHQRGGAPVLDRAAGSGKLPPTIVVLADGGRTSMYVNRGDKANYQDLITKDLLAHVDGKYRVSKDRSQRALMGISMGGMAALRIGFTQPALFGTIAVHSAAVFPEDPQQLPDRMKQMASRIGLDEVFGNPIDAEKWRKANPLCLAQDVDPKALDGLRIYFDAGTEDRFRFADGNGLLHEALEKKGIPHTWLLVEGGGHAWGSGFKEESLLASLAFAGEGFAVRSATKGALEGMQLPGGAGGKGETKDPKAGESKGGQ